MLRKKRSIAVLGLANAMLLAAPTLALADNAQTAFYVSSSGDSGRVNYDIRLNPDCSPVGSAPVYYYWRKDDGSTRPLNGMEQIGYGINHQSVSGNTVTLALNAFQDHGITKALTITSSKATNGTCKVQAFTTIDGSSAQLEYAMVQVDRTKILGQTVGLHVLSITLVGADQASETVACSSNCTYGVP
jgi:hypothetical protein